MTRFPWHQLLDQRAFGAAPGRVGSVAPDALAQALTSTLGSEVRVERVGSAAERAASTSSEHALRAGERSFRIAFEPDWVAAAAAALVRTPPGLGRPLPLSDALSGVAAALAVTIARQLDLGVPVSLDSLAEPLSPAQWTTFSVTLETRRYAIELGEAALARPEPPVALDALGDLPLSVPLVIATCTSSRRQLSSLCVGDGWVPEACSLDTARLGRAILAPATLGRGLWVDVTPGGIVHRGEQWLAPTESDMAEQAGEMEDLMLDAPVLIRIEVGQLTLTAREWARIAPGDVIAAGLPLGSETTLRVDGREVASGELVNVDGELGVRISRVAGRGADETQT